MADAPRKRRTLLLPALIVILAIAAGAYYLLRARATTLVLTGLVTTNDVVVSAQVGGQLAHLNVKEGDTVTHGQLVASLAPEEMQADSAYFTRAAEGATTQVQQSEAALRLEEAQTKSAIDQAQATLSAAAAQQASAKADLENAQTTFERTQKLVQSGAAAQSDLDQARTGYDAAKAHLDALAKQTEAARAAVAMAQANSEQIAVRRSQVQTSEFGSAAASAQQQKAAVRLAYMEVHAPIDGIVDVRAAREGEVVAAGQPIVTLINPDDLWVRADVEETYIDRIHIGDHLTVRLPSGEERQGTVFFRGIDAGFATQRDVSRTKRDIKTFEIRLRVDNKDRALAIGMTAYVLLPVPA